MSTLLLHPDRLFPADPTTRGIARSLYAAVRDLPIVSPHGHTDPAWFATNRPWTNATELLLSPDHYLFRMLYSQGIALDDLAVPRRDGTIVADPRRAWGCSPPISTCSVARRRDCGSTMCSARCSGSTKR